MFNAGHDVGREERPPRCRELRAANVQVSGVDECMRIQMRIPCFIVKTEVLRQVGRQARSWRTAADILDVEVVSTAAVQLLTQAERAADSRATRIERTRTRSEDVTATPRGGRHHGAVQSRQR